MDVQTYLDGAWHSGNTPLMGSTTQASWLAHSIFDGARAFQGVTPDLDRHCARAIRSAESMAMEPPVTAAQIEALAREGIARFPAGAELYIRPMFWIETGMVVYQPSATRFALVIVPMAMPADQPFSACLSRYRRPGPDQAPTKAKASCLYPLAAMAVQEAKKRGFDNAVMPDPLGHVAEFTSSNLFFVKDGVVITPIPNDTFLNGITRQRVLGLLRDAGVPVQERTVEVGELQTADEIFSTGNYAKLMPVHRYEDHDLQVGPLYRQARQLYFDWALSA